MSISSAERFKLRKLLKELSTYKGRHTELVTVYIPKDYDMTKVINHLAQEQGTATNIKSASTKKNVITALERMIQHLRLFKQTPLNGLAVFSGNVAEREGQQDFKVWSFEPPLPLKTRIYRCDKTFILEQLYEMLEVTEVYALVVVDTRDANIALLRGKTIVPMAKTHSEVQGKFRAGGQSAVRFSRLREGAIHNHFKKVAEHMKDQLFHLTNLKGIIIGGPGPTKYNFIDSGCLTNELKQKIISVQDLSYTGEFGLEELLEKSQDVLANEEVIEEKKLLQKFFQLLATRPKIVSYGEKETMKLLEFGAVDKLLLSESLDDETIEKFEAKAKEQNSEAIIISTETREGVQLKDLGKIAAILRYELAL